MANTYTSIHIQFVFCVKYREAMLHSAFENRLFRYTTNIIQQHGHKLIAINGLPDHLHILAGIRPVESISEIADYLKACTSKWINENEFTSQAFRWQAGFGAFSYSRTELPNVIHYIETQKLIHESIHFKDEYLSLLNEHGVSVDNRYIFEFFD